MLIQPQSVISEILWPLTIHNIPVFLICTSNNTVIGESTPRFNFKPTLVYSGAQILSVRGKQNYKTLLGVLIAEVLRY